MTNSHNAADNAPSNSPSITVTRTRKRRTDREITPLQLRKRALSRVASAVKRGALLLLDGSVPCSDCGEPANCYDHRNYFHPLAVDPVCTGCNNRRGPGFPLNPDGNEYRNESAKKLGGSAGERWSNLGGGISDQRPGSSPHSLLKNMPEKSVAEFIDEHWLTWELDNDLRKYRQWCSIKKKRSFWFTKSFSRALFDWYGIEPI